MNRPKKLRPFLRIAGLMTLLLVLAVPPAHADSLIEFLSNTKDYVPLPDDVQEYNGARTELRFIQPGQTKVSTLKLANIKVDVFKNAVTVTRLDDGNMGGRFVFYFENEKAEIVAGSPSEPRSHLQHDAIDKTGNDILAELKQGNVVIRTYKNLTLADHYKLLRRQQELDLLRRYVDDNPKVKALIVKSPDGRDIEDLWFYVIDLNEKGPTFRSFYVKPSILTDQDMKLVTRLEGILDPTNIHSINRNAKDKKHDT